MSRGKVRDPGPLSPYRLTSTSSRAPGTTVISTMTKKPKRVPKSSAAKKRSRALRTTLDGVGGAGGRGFLSNDVTARFPMPYPGVERGRPPRNATTVVLAAGKAPHQQHEKTKSSPEENKGRASHANRETLRAPGTSPGVARKHRKRPRSAILPPSRAEFSRTTTAFPPASSVLLLAKKESGGQVSSSKSKRNNAELSGATSIMPHGRGGLIRGGKKLRCVVRRGVYAFRFYSNYARSHFVACCMFSDDYPSTGCNISSLVRTSPQHQQRTSRADRSPYVRTR